MNTIPLSVLLDALAAMQMMREVADEKMTGEQYMQGLRAYSALKANVEHVTKQIKVECV